MLFVFYALVQPSFRPSPFLEPRIGLSLVSENVGKASLSWIGGSFPPVHFTRIGATAPRIPRPWRNSLKQIWCFGLTSEPLVCKPLTDDLGKRQREPSAVIVVALVVTKRLFVKIPERMERLDAHVCAFQPALQERPEVLDAVRVDVPLNVAFGVVDHLMDIIDRQAVVGTPSVAEYTRAALDIFAHNALQRRAAGIGNVAQADFLRLAIQEAHHDCFAGPARRRDLASLILMHEASGTADKRLVYLEIACDLSERAILHRFANAVEHEPCAFLRNTQIAGDLAGANAILAVGDQPDRREPFVETDRRVLKDGADLGAELLLRVLGLALPNAARGEQGHLRATARRTSHTVRPAQRNRRAHAVIGIREISDRFVKRGRYIRVHALKIAQGGW
jgi:hypothetical protein